MTAVIFAGPTLSSDDIMSVCECTCLPPAARGDVYRSALTKPTAIGIIDGYFQGELSVWHKEILWAMSQGIHVFGCSSMGALRAAELCDFGMRGVGRIFEDYQSRRVEDDDEVAVLHGPQEMGFLPLSEPMVNIRATLQRAADDSVIDCANRDFLIAAAKKLFYHHRNWEAILAVDGIDALGDAKRLSFCNWLPEGYVDLKMNDAFEMLNVLQEFVSSEPPPMTVNFAFEWTHLWDRVATDFVANYRQTPNGGGDVSSQQLLDELHVDPSVYHRLKQDALLRLLALKESHRRQPVFSNDVLRARMNEFRMENRLLTRGALDDWLVANRLDDDGLLDLIEEDARIEALSLEAGRELEPHMYSSLRSSGEFAQFHARAVNKKKVLERSGQSDVEPSDLDLANVQLVEWYFEVHLDQEIPHDLGDYIRRSGFYSLDYFYRFLAREFFFASKI